MRTRGIWRGERLRTQPNKQRLRRSQPDCEDYGLSKSGGTSTYNHETEVNYRYSVVRRRRLADFCHNGSFDWTDIDGPPDLNPHGYSGVCTTLLQRNSRLFF